MKPHWLSTAKRSTRSIDKKPQAVRKAVSDTLLGRLKFFS